MNYLYQNLRDYAFSFVGRAYLWGGDDPMAGFDCSGYVLEILKAVGLVPSRQDMTAKQLFAYLTTPPGVRGLSVKEAEFGDILFFGKSTDTISHVAFALDRATMLEAGGGGSKTLTEKDAIDQNAFVRMRPIGSRADLVAIVHPNYGGQA